MTLFTPIPVNVSSQLDIGTFFKITSIGDVVSNVLALALIFGGLAFILFFVMSALQWLTAGGDKTHVEAAKQRMTNAATGLVLVAAAWAVYLIAIYVLGLPINPI